MAYLRRTHAVSLKKANPFGLYDINGNVWEWVQDFYGDYPHHSVSDPTGPAAGDSHIVRGGCWHNSAQYLRSANRGNARPDERINFVGFRLVRTRK